MGSVVPRSRHGTSLMIRNPIGNSMLRSRAFPILVAAILAVIAFVSLMRPSTEPGPAITPSNVPGPVADRGSLPAELPAPPPPPAASQPSALRGESFRLHCAAPELEDGPVAFVRLEPFGPVARRLSVSERWLEGESDVPEGDGDLVRDGRLVGRLEWHEVDGEAACGVKPVPWVEIAGSVVDERGRPAGDVLVTGCGAEATTDPGGSFALSVPEGRSCRVRALRSAPVPAASEVVAAEAPSAIVLTIESRTEDEVAGDLERRVLVLKGLEEINLQQATILGEDAPTDGDAAAELSERRARIEAALASGDPEVILQEWIGDE
jgi:hypothetical protein